METFKSKHWFICQPTLAPTVLNLCEMFTISLLSSNCFLYPCISDVYYLENICAHFAHMQVWTPIHQSLSNIHTCPMHIRPSGWCRPTLAWWPLHIGIHSLSHRNSSTFPWSTRVPFGGQMLYMYVGLAVMWLHVFFCPTVKSVVVKGLMVGSAYDQSSKQFKDSACNRLLL